MIWNWTNWFLGNCCQLSLRSGLLVISLSLIVIYWWCQKKRTSCALVIPGPPPYPIIGNVFEMLQGEATDMFRNWISTYGRVLRYKVFLLGTQVLVTDVKSLRRVLVTNVDNYEKPETLLLPCRKMFGSQCLICLPREDHDSYRRIMNPAFRGGNIRLMSHIFVRKTHKLLNLWTEKRQSLQLEPGADCVIDVQKGITCLSLDILGECVFGFEFNSLSEPSGELASALHRIVSIQTFNFIRFLPFYDYLPTQINRDTVKIKNLLKHILQEKRSFRAGLVNDNSDQGEEAPCSLKILDKSESEVTKPDLLDHLLREKEITEQRQQTSVNIEREDVGSVKLEPQHKKNLKKVLTDDALVDNIHQFLIAGHETVSNSLCFALLQLAKYPEIQELARKEALRELAPSVINLHCSCKGNESEADPISESNASSINQSESCGSKMKAEPGTQCTSCYAQACQGLPYIECIIRETLRMFPPVPITLRKAKGHDELLGYHIPPGTVLALHVGTTMRLPEYYEDPDAFRPERFAGRRNGPMSGAFLPFLSGPDICIGYKFAMCEMKAVIANLLMNVEMATIQGQEYRGKQGLTYHLDPALQLSVKPLREKTF